MKKGILVVAIGLIYFSACKSVIQDSSEVTISREPARPVLKRMFKPLPFATKNDSLLIAKIIASENDIDKEDGANYYDAKIFYPKDSTFKVVNLYGESGGGATYNPFAKSHIVINNRITDTVFSGEIFRVDKMRDHFVLYFDDYWRLGSNFRVYKVNFSGDSLTASNISKHGNYLFDLIRNKKETPETFPNTFDFSTRYSPNEVNALDLDTTKIGLNDYYFLGEALFLTKYTDSLDFQIYFTHKYGDELTKMLRIRSTNAVYERLLARNGGDSNSYETSTEFVNDSVFVEIEINTETARDDTSVMAYETDSIVKTFLYDNQFHFKEISQKRFKLYKEFGLIGNEWKEQKRTITGRPFKINGHIAIWKYELDYSYDDQGQKLSHGNIYKTLTDTLSKKVILKDLGDFIDFSRIDVEEDASAFGNMNFDSYNDYQSYNNSSSGSAGEFTNVFIYNPLKREFELSKNLSGYNIEVDEVKRKVTTFAKSGSGQYFISVTYFNKKSQIEFSEALTSIYRDADQKMVFSYKKYKSGKVISQKTKVFDYAQMQGEDIYQYLMEMAAD